MLLGTKNYTTAIYLQLLDPDPLLLNGILLGYDLEYGVFGAQTTVAIRLQAPNKVSIMFDNYLYFKHLITILISRYMYHVMMMFRGELI